MAVIGISSEALCTDELSATTAHRDTDLVTELILRACLALGDAIPMWPYANRPKHTRPTIAFRLAPEHEQKTTAKNT
jgi:hypothetical protein